MGVSSLKALELGIEVGGCGGSYDLLFSDVLQVVPDVPLDGFVEEDRLLADHSEGAAQVVQIVVLDVDSFEEDLSLGGPIESQ